VRAQTDASARKNLGIAVVDVRIKRIDLPNEVSESVYKRMRAERLQLANELRCTGQESAETIQADADRQGQVLRADARRDAAKIRGEGDAEAAAIYAKAYSQDPEFFRFYRSLAAYRKAFEDGKGVLIMKPGNEFLHYCESPEGLTLLVAPARWQAMMREALNLPPRMLRVVGAAAVVSGLLLLQLFH
jgi:membrane protease subunit HflC